VTSIERCDRCSSRCFVFTTSDGPSEIRSSLRRRRPDTWRLALRAAESSVVLLKDDGVLPLTRGDSSIALIGTDADQGIIDAGAAVRESSRVTSSRRCRDFERRSVRSATSSTPRVDRSPKTSTPFRAARRERPTAQIGHAAASVRRTGKADLRIDEAPNVTPYVVTAAAPRRGRFG